MIKMHLIVGIFLLAVTGCGTDPSKQTNNSVPESSLSDSTKQQIQDFWIIYRQATRNRIDGSWEQAIEGYSQALTLNAEHEDAIYYLGNMHLELNDYKKAEESWLLLLEVNPASARGHFQLGKLYFNPRAPGLYHLDKAKLKFEQTIEINQDFLQPVLLQAQVAIIQQEYVQSARYLEVIFGSDEKNIEAWLLSGYIAFNQEDLKQATTDLNRAAKLVHKQSEKSKFDGEGDTKTGQSLERTIGQSLFSEYQKQLENFDGVISENQVDKFYSEMATYIASLDGQ